MQQGLSHRLEHILKGADPGEDHGGIQNDGEEPAQGDVLQNSGEGDKQQGGSGPHVQPVGKAGGDDHQGSNQRGDGVKEGGLLGQGHHVLLRAEVGAVDNHAAAGNGQGEEGLSHGPDPHHGVQQLLPAAGEHIAVALGRAGEEGHPHRQHDEDDEKEGHHHLVAPLNALGPQQQRQQGAHHHDDMEGDHGVVREGEPLKPGGGVRRHKGAGDRGVKGLEHIGDDDGVADGDAHGACQRKPAQKPAGPAQTLPPAGPGHAVGAQGAGAGPAAHGVLGGEAHRAEEQDEGQVGD